MKKKPLVSIIMNVYNGEKYLRESIKSVIKQSYKNWELIFWDNNSKDDSKKIFFGFKDQRLKYYFYKKKITLYASRNLALLKCKGDLIAFLDQDDLWLKDKLKKQIYLFKDEDTGLVYSNYYKLNENKFFFKKKILTNEKLPEGKITNYLLKKYVIGLCTILVKKKFLKQKKIFKPKFNMLGDFLFVLNFSRKYNFRCCQEPLAVYRYHNQQMSKSFYSISVNQHLKWISNKSEIKNFMNFPNFKFLKKKINFMKIVDFINKGQNINAIKQIYKFPSSVDKCKLLLRLVLPESLFYYLFGQLY